VAESVRESGGKVLVHCRAGISRSATVCIAYLMYAARASLDDAHDYLKRCRPLVSPNLNFMRQLADFETRLAAEKCSNNALGGLRQPADQLVASVVGHCSARLSRMDRPPPPPVCPPTSVDAVAVPRARKPLLPPAPFGEVPRLGREAAVESCAVGRKRARILSDLLLPCGGASTPAKVLKVGALQPPPTPCMKQSFLFDFATVAVLMSGGHANPASPTVTQSPLVSPS